MQISVGDPVDFLAGSWIPDPGSDSLKIRVNPWSRLPDPDLSDFGRILGAESRIRIPTILLKLYLLAIKGRYVINTLTIDVLALEGA